MEEVVEAKYFSTFDVSAGFWQVPLEKQSFMTIGFAQIWRKQELVG